MVTSAYLHTISHWEPGTETPVTMPSRLPSPSFDHRQSPTKLLDLFKHWLEPFQNMSLFWPNLTPFPSVTNCDTWLTPLPCKICHRSQYPWQYAFYWLLRSNCHDSLLSLNGESQWATAYSYTHWNQSDRPTTSLPSSLHDVLIQFIQCFKRWNALLYTKKRVI